MTDQCAICERLENLGYESERPMKLYGKEFHLVSDPIPDGDGFAVEGIARRSGYRLSARARNSPPTMTTERKVECRINMLGLHVPELLLSTIDADLPSSNIYCSKNKV